MALRTKRRSPEAQPATQDIEWSKLMDEAMTMPGSLGSQYNRFYTYSFLNQVLLFSQGVLEPVATYKRWNDMGRQVMKGSKAKSILRPITVDLKDQLDDNGQPKKITKFKMVKCLFGASETEGDDLPEYEPVEWSAERALGSLAINRVAFGQLDGNTQGWSADRDVAINPVARYPFKTLMHEVGHIALGHTAETTHEEYTAHRGMFEFQAEGTAYLVLNELQTPEDQWSPSDSRGYIQSWLRGQKPPDDRIKGVFKATDTILRAGRELPTGM